MISQNTQLPSSADNNPSGQVISSSIHKLLQPITIRSLTIPNRLWQAPLAGYASWPFRLLAWQLGNPGLVATEMISSRALEQSLERQTRYLIRHQGEGIVQYQLWGADPESLGKATQIVTDYGADTIDLNCGCPVKKVRSAGAGSKLMENPQLIGAIVAAMRKNTHLPLSIKIRVGTSKDNFNGLEVAKIAVDAGIDFITIHGRHAQESYATPVRVEAIQAIRECLDIPVCGNGNVDGGASAEYLIDNAGVDAVMVGRFCLGCPWVFAKIRAELSGQVWSMPEAAVVGQALLIHHDGLAELDGVDKAVRASRKLGAYYSRHLCGGREFREQINLCHTREQLVSLIDRYFNNGSWAK